MSNRHADYLKSGDTLRASIMAELLENLGIPVNEFVERVKKIHERDLADGWGRVQMPTALDRKYPNAPAEWRWQWVFPQENRWVNQQIKEQGRHHTDESLSYGRAG